MTLTQERPAAATQPPTTAVTEESPQEEVLRPRRWTTAEYYRLGELGIFDDERVELLDGEIWTLPPQGTPHYSAIRRAIDALEVAFGEGFDLRQEAPMTLEDGTEPEPDVLFVVGSWRDYEGHHPSALEVCLLIEVADVTLPKDRDIKVKCYAQAGIADYWIINLVNRQLEVYRDPSPIANGFGYKTLLTLLNGDTLAPLSVLNGTIAVSDLFPPLATL